MRWLAKEVGLSSGALSEFLGGKRVPTQATALKITKALALSSQETARLTYLITGKAALRRRELSPEEFEVFEDWVTRLIFELCSRPQGLNPSKLDFSTYGLSSERAKKSLKRLSTLGLIEKNAAGFFQRAHEQVATTDGSFSKVVRAMHRSDLTFAQECIDRLSVDQRTLSSVIFNCRKSDLRAIKKEVGEFLSRLQLVYETPEGDGACFSSGIVVDLSEVLNEMD